MHIVIQESLFKFFGAVFREAFRGDFTPGIIGI